MSNAIVPVVPKRNATTGDSYPMSLALGELAVNTTTGNVYLGADPGVVRIGVPVAAGTVLNVGTGDGSTVAFTIAGGTGTDAGGYLVSVGGIDQPSGWTVAGTTLTFSEAPPAGAAVSVRAILKGEGGGGGNATQLQSRDIAATTPTLGQLLAWRNNQWVPWGHMYAHSIYWSDDQTLANGSYLWTANFTDAVAANVNFIEGAYTITTDSNGLVTKALTQNWYDDSSDLHHAVTLNGGVTQVDEGGGVKVASFDGSGNYLNTEISAIGTDIFTIEMFFNATGFESDLDANILFATGSDSSFGSTVVIGFDSSLNLFAYSGTARTGDTAIQTNIWNHLALVRDNSTVGLYLNGVLVNSETSSDDLSQTITYIAANNANIRMRPFGGKIAGLRVIKGVALYSGSYYIIPTSLLTAVSGTQLLLNFEATAVPTV